MAPLDGKRKAVKENRAKNQRQNGYPIGRGVISLKEMKRDLDNCQELERERLLPNDKQKD